MNKEELIRLLGNKETQNIELKESLSLKDEIGEAISAFSNSAGGIVLVGVKDNKEIAGLKIGKRTVEEQAREDLSKMVSLNLLAKKGKARLTKYNLSGSIRKLN